jgi:hypothetical protein
VESEPIFNVAWLVQATLHQFINSRLRSGALKGGDTCVPLRGNFCVGREARNIDKSFRFRDGLFVEGSNAYRQRVDKSVELRVRQSTIDVAIKFGEAAANIVGAEQALPTPAPGL